MALSGVLCSRPLLISKENVTVSPSTYSRVQGGKRELSTPVCAKCSLFMFVQNNLFYLDQVFGPSCPQDTATAISQSVPSILCYFTAVGVGTSVDDQLKCQRGYLVKNISSQSFAMLDKWHKLYASVKGDGTLS